MKKLLISVCCLFLLTTTCGCQISDTYGKNDISYPYTFIDSCGRTITIPEEIKKIVPAGKVAQIYLMALCPDLVVAINDSFSSKEATYYEPYLALPVIGQIHGSGDKLHTEILADLGPQVIVDIGKDKANIAAEMDEVTKETGIPSVHISASLENSGETFRMLGSLLGREVEAEKLAGFCDENFALIQRLLEKVEKKNALYISGYDGFNVMAKGSDMAEVFDLLTNNLAELDEPSSKGSGDRVDMAQIQVWNPDYLMISSSSIFTQVAHNKDWQQINAVKNGDFHRIPIGPNDWLGYPPSVQRIMGMLWLADTLYPDQTDFDLKKKTKEFFKLFYHCELSDAQYEEITAETGEKTQWEQDKIRSIEQ